MLDEACGLMLGIGKKPDGNRYSRETIFIVAKRPCLSGKADL